MKVKVIMGRSLPAIISAFWYITLFPGRLGFDSAEAIRMIQNGLSTDWWSASYFWFLRLTTLGGITIAIASLIQMAMLFLALQQFILSLPVKRETARIAFIVILASPFYGFFSAGISHDVFLVSGIFLILSEENKRIFFLDSERGKIKHIIYYGSLVMTLSMTKIGLFILIVYAVILAARKRLLKAICIFSGTVVFYLISSVGISSQASGYYLWPALADLKCITQHPQADISPSQWQVLEKISSKELWQKPISCASMDQAVESLGLSAVTKIPSGLNLVRNYLAISKQNPAILIMSHINRSRVALPPPFFPIPQNQVDLDINHPIGLGTNTALQSGPEVLHPSIDEKSVEVNVGPVRFLERFVQIPVFLINQASWFWGWGGLWLWPIAFFYFKKLPIDRTRKTISANWPTVFLHLFLVAFAPNSLPRYVMSTVLCGIILSTCLLGERYFETRDSAREESAI